MPDGIQRGTGNVLAFPVRGRFASAAMAVESSRPTVERPVIVEAGAGWYHEAAIREAEPKGNA